jgi:23S rRNA (uracil1939-C5)-methyltransferase
MVSRGDILELTIDSVAFEGKGVARTEGLVVFVPFGVPGDRIRARVIRKRRRHLEAVIEELLEASPDRIEPRCPHFGVCGGCSSQNVEYSLQLEFKREQVRELLRRIGGFEAIPVAPTLASPDPYYYRNKMEFSFGSRRWLLPEEIASETPLEKDFALGLHIPGRFDRILDLQACFLQSPLSAEILNWTRDFAMRAGWAPYDPRAHQGFARNLVIRTGWKSAEVMVVLVTTDGSGAEVARYGEAMQAAFPQVTTLLHSIHSGRSPVAAGAPTEPLFGRGWISERIADKSFRVGPFTFFQPNSAQTEKLFEVIADFADLSAGTKVWDLYSGVGAISIFLAESGASFVGVESSAEAVKAAGLNAADNGLQHLQFVVGEVEKIIDEGFVQEMGRPDVVILDPPRAGLHVNALHRLLAVSAERIVYISCNPATQARDLKMLSPDYRIGRVQPVDMFPQTPHIENVVELIRDRPVPVKG